MTLLHLLTMLLTKAAGIPASSVRGIIEAAANSDTDAAGPAGVVLAKVDETLSGLDIVRHVQDLLARLTNIGETAFTGEPGDSSIV